MTTMGDTEAQLPIWAQRLRKSQIERLDRSSAQGLLDKELIDEVGYALLARCESLLQVGEAVRGRPMPQLWRNSQRRLGIPPPGQVRRLWMGVPLVSLPEDIGEKT